MLNAPSDNAKRIGRLVKRIGRLVKRIGQIAKRIGRIKKMYFLLTFMMYFTLLFVSLRTETGA